MPGWAPRVLGPSSGHVLDSVGALKCELGFAQLARPGLHCGAEGSLLQPPLNNFLKIFYLFIFRERGREGERERNINVWLPLMHPLLGTWTETQACVLTGN